MRHAERNPDDMALGGDKRGLTRDGDLNRTVPDDEGALVIRHLLRPRRITWLQTHPRSFQAGIIDDLVAPAYRGVFIREYLAQLRQRLVRAHVRRQVYRLWHPGPGLCKSLRGPQRADRYRTQDRQSTFPQISHVLLLTL